MGWILKGNLRDFGIADAKKARLIVTWDSKFKVNGIKPPPANKYYYFNDRGFLVDPRNRPGLHLLTTTEDYVLILEGGPETLTAQLPSPSSGTYDMRDVFSDYSDGYTPPSSAVQPYDDTELRQMIKEIAPPVLKFPESDGNFLNASYIGDGVKGSVTAEDIDLINETWANAIGVPFDPDAEPDEFMMSLLDFFKNSELNLFSGMDVILELESSKSPSGVYRVDAVLSVVPHEGAGKYFLGWKYGGVQARLQQEERLTDLEKAIQPVLKTLSLTDSGYLFVEDNKLFHLTVTEPLSNPAYLHAGFRNYVGYWRITNYQWMWWPDHWNIHGGTDKNEVWVTVIAAGGEYHVFVPDTPSPESGPSSSRPTGQVDVGTYYLDTDLGKPIWVKSIDTDGSPAEWVDANGAIVS